MGEHGDWSRRGFLTAAMAAALAELAAVGGARADDRPVLPPAPPGYCPPAAGELEETLWALAETIVPGRATDPARAPGANECCALSVLLAPELPTAQFAGLVQTLLDNLARQRFGAPFRELGPYAQRAEVAEAAEAQLPLLTLLYRLIRSAFYASAYNEVGARWMGYPGPNLGYVHHDGFTLGRPIGVELTEDGNLP